MRNSRSSVRLISLTPPKLSTNEVLDYIIEDTIAMNTSGVDGWDPQGNRFKIFMDIMGFIADCPAMTHVMDASGHNATVSCSICSFVRQKSNSRTSHVYTTKVHYQNNSRSRCMEKHEEILKIGISENDVQFMGLSLLFSSESTPLLSLARALQICAAQIPLNTKGELVVGGLFHPYRSAVVAPDHLLKGIATDVLLFSFRLLRGKEDRKRMDVLLCALFHGNGFLKQSEAYNTEINGLQNMTISGK